MFCAFCHLSIAIAGNRVKEGEKDFHIECYTKYEYEKRSTWNDRKKKFWAKTHKLS